jgi:hypothetical protein
MLKFGFGISRTIVLLLVCLIFIYACGPEGQPIPPAITPTHTSPPPEPTETSEPTIVPTIGTDIQVELLEGDRKNGEYMFIILGCDGCHASNPIGLKFHSEEGLPNIIERGEMRMADPEYNGSASTNVEYVIESIVLPGAYHVDGWWDEGGMPTDYGDRMTEQDLADVFAWLETFE